MNNNNLSTITDQQTITSMEIAEITGKYHFDVLKAIRKMEPAWEKVAASKFSCSSTKDRSGKMIPLYLLTKTECLFVATKFNDEARAKLVLRWEQLEKERLASPKAADSRSGCVAPEVRTGRTDSNLPVDPRNMSRLQILQLAIEAEQENVQLKEQVQSLEADNYGLMIESGQKDQEIAQLQERTAYLNAIMADSTTVTVSQIAQDYGMGAPSFNKLLRGLGIQRRVGDQWVLYSDYIGKGYVATRTIPIHHAGRPDTHKPLTVWTPVGRKFLYERLKKHGMLPVIERGRAS